jgi:hypothetical protein
MGITCKVDIIDYSVSGEFGKGRDSEGKEDRGQEDKY